jgi:hypothetical protein
LRGLILTDKLLRRQRRRILLGDNLHVECAEDPPPPSPMHRMMVAPILKRTLTLTPRCEQMMNWGVCSTDIFYIAYCLSEAVTLCVELRELHAKIVA